MFLAIPVARVVDGTRLSNKLFEKWARELADDGELKLFYGRGGLRAVGRPVPRGVSPLGAQHD